jgi:hypothetical protein
MAVNRSNKKVQTPFIKKEKTPIKVKPNAYAQVSLHQEPSVHEWMKVIVITSRGKTHETVYHRPIGKTSLDPNVWVVSTPTGVDSLLQRIKNPYLSVLNEKISKEILKERLKQGLLVEIEGKICYGSGKLNGKERKSMLDLRSRASTPPRVKDVITEAEKQLDVKNDAINALKQTLDSFETTYDSSQTQYQEAVLLGSQDLIFNEVTRVLDNIRDHVTSDYVVTPSDPESEEEDVKPPPARKKFLAEDELRDVLKLLGEEQPLDELSKALQEEVAPRGILKLEATGKKKPPDKKSGSALSLTPPVEVSQAAPLVKKESSSKSEKKDRKT